MQANRFCRYLFCAVAVAGSASCVGMAVETVTDAAIAVGKVPFKVGGAVVDVVTGDDDGEKHQKDDDGG